LPPLRQRPTDILPLATHFVGLYSPRLRQGPAQLDAAAYAAPLQYAWPGNIRELENVMHAAVLTCNDDRVIRPANLRFSS
jgi:sigma-54-specific transcriptional regulator